MNIGSVSKAIAAGVGGAAGTAAVTTLILPPEVNAPWWGYLLAFVVATLVPAIVTYLAPKNTEPKRDQE